MLIFAGEKFKHEQNPSAKPIGKIGISVHMLHLTHKVYQLIKPYLVLGVQPTGYVLDLFPRLMPFRCIVGIT